MTWTLTDLAAVAADALSALPAPANGQVRAVPDVRTLRWYGQLGLLDRPLGWRGRAGIYGPRHLQQILAVKHLQAASWTIDEIQALLLGASDDQLAQWSAGALPATPVPTPASPAAPAASRAERAFWSEPAAASVPPATDALVRLTLGHGAELLLPAAHDRDGLESALAPLRAWLARITPENVP